MQGALPCRVPSVWAPNKQVSERTTSPGAKGGVLLLAAGIRLFGAVRLAAFSYRVSVLGTRHVVAQDLGVFPIPGTPVLCHSRIYPWSCSP